MSPGRFATLLAAIVLLGGCASNAPEPEPPTERQTLDRSARLAFDQARYAQASTLYASALQQALLEDDPGAIVDARFNLALSYTYLGRYEEALNQLTQADAERRRRGLAADPQLLLLEATVLYRSGTTDDAQRLLDGLFQLAPAGGAMARRGHFLAGLIAADAADVATLRRHIDALRQTAAADSWADLLELQGALAGQQGDAQTAYDRFDEAATVRGIERDYRGMARALANAGDVAANAGDTALAASYFLRAGRSAAQRDQPEAREWLRRAGQLGESIGDSALALEAAELMGRTGGAD